jgi:hypothetical protein
MDKLVIKARTTTVGKKLVDLTNIDKLSIKELDEIIAMHPEVKV